MGTTLEMPNIRFLFESAGLRAIQRADRGIALVILKGTKAVSKTYSSLADVKEEEYSKENYRIIQDMFEFSPFLVKVETYNEERTLDKLLKDLILQRFNYYCAPTLDETEKKKVLSWHKNITKVKQKTIKFVTSDIKDSSYFLLNWEEEWVDYDGRKYTKEEFTPILTSAVCSLQRRSLTYFKFKKITDCSLTFAEDENKAVSEGKLFLTYDGENYKIGRGVNAYTEINENQGEDFCKIKIVDSLHLVQDSIRDTFSEYYVGQVTNSYDNKKQFLNLINRVFLPTLYGEILEAEGNNYLEIDIEANRKYAITRKADVDNMTEEQIKRYNTGSNLFVKGKLSVLDAMEDLNVNFFLE